MINCCTASKAISIIHGHPDGLWEGYMGGWKENVIRGLLGTMVLITFDYFKQELLGKFPSTVKIEMNKDMNLYFDLNQISLFNKESKERI